MFRMLNTGCETPGCLFEKERTDFYSVSPGKDPGLWMFRRVLGGMKPPIQNPWWLASPFEHNHSSLLGCASSVVQGSMGEKARFHPGEGGVQHGYAKSQKEEQEASLRLVRPKHYSSLKTVKSCVLPV